MLFYFIYLLFRSSSDLFILYNFAIGFNFLRLPYWSKIQLGILLLNKIRAIHEQLKNYKMCPSASLKKYVPTCLSRYI